MAQLAGEGLGDNYFIQTFTTTLQRYEKQLVDNVLLEHPTLELFKSVAKSVTGRGLVVPVRSAKLGVTDYIDTSAGQISSAVSPEIMGSAVYEWAKEIVTPFRLKHRDILMNSGAEQIVSLVEEYVKAAQASHQDFIVAELHKHRSNWAAEQIFSLDMLVGNADTDDQVWATPDAQGAGVGGIHPSSTIQDKAFWQATRVYQPMGAGVDIVAAMRATTNEIYKKSRKRPTDVIAGFDAFEELEKFLMSKGQYTSPQGPQNGTANTRFTTIMFGDLNVRLDPDCQADRMYFLQRSSLRFAYLAGEFMKTYAAMPVQNTLDTVVPIASTLLFGVAERRANGVLILAADLNSEEINPPA